MLIVQFGKKRFKMKTKVLVLGSTGLIGHQVYNYLQLNSNYELFNIAFRRKLNNDTILVDVRNEENFIDNIEKISPNVIINCIGILIKGSNLNPENAIFINSYLPHRLMRLADTINAKLIHISTDCVFSGRKNSPYIETDEKDGLDVYAKTKGLGEIINDKHLTLRTSVVGPELKENGEELFHWFMGQKGSINGYTKAIWSGVSTLELAKAVKWAIENNITGLYHITNGESINKYELLNLFKKYTKKEIVINPDDSKIVNKRFVDTRKLINYDIPSYDKMIKEMVDLITNNPLYKMYNL